MRDFLEELNNAYLKKRTSCSNLKIDRISEQKFQVTDERITVDVLFRRHNEFVSADYLVIVDVGDALFVGSDLVIHKGTEFISPAYYLSMGVAIPGSVGVQLANSKIRPHSTCR